MKLANRLVSLLLAAGMTMSLVPVSAFAEYTGGVFILTLCMRRSWTLKMMQ